MNAKIPSSSRTLAEVAIAMLEVLEVLTSEAVTAAGADPTVFNAMTALRDDLKPQLEAIIRRGR